MDFFWNEIVIHGMLAGLYFLMQVIHWFIPMFGMLLAILGIAWIALEY